jgi:DNA-binding transcriptional LysR family regulator
MTFAAVAKIQNISRAAAELHVTQASISHQLKRLQNEYKTKLYVKNGRGIVLTPTGLTFLKHVQTILNQVRELDHDFKVNRATEKSRSLTVGGTFAPSASLLPQALAPFKKSHPQIQLNLRTDNRMAIERMVLNSDVEIGVINQPARSPGLVSEPFRREKIAAFAPPNHPLTRKQKLSFRDLMGNPLIIRDAMGGVGSTERMLRQYEPNLRPNIVLRCQSPDAVKTAVRKKMGIGLLFESTVALEIQSGDFKKLRLSDAKLEGMSYIIYKKGHPLSANGRDFLNLLRKFGL